MTEAAQVRRTMGRSVRAAIYELRRRHGGLRLLDPAQAAHYSAALRELDLLVASLDYRNPVKQKADAVAEMAACWLAGERQQDICKRLGYAGNTVVSVKLRWFVSKYLPDREFAYNESRKKVIGEALAAYRRSKTQ